MPCDKKLRQGQTLPDRARELRKAGAAIDKLLATNRAKVRIDRRTGGVVFDGIPDDVRADMNDACVYNRIMAGGSFAARQAIAKAERLSGRAVNRKAVEAGLHSHDGGATWGRD